MLHTPSPRYISGLSLAPFLYPFTRAELRSATRYYDRFNRPKSISTTRESRQEGHESYVTPEDTDTERLNPAPDSYSLAPFVDKCTLTLQAGSGGHGCVSFLREKFIALGPPNGGDGGSGGNLYIQAVRGETSLHKLARRGQIKAGTGEHGQGKSKGGQRGEDVILKVPVGTVVRELWRHDPVKDEEDHIKLTGSRKAADSKEKWVVYPGSEASIFFGSDAPNLPPPRRSHLSSLEPEAPLRLDLDKPMAVPMVLAAGALGGLGNPHFVREYNKMPKFATKGNVGMRLGVQLELKLLADVGLVGLPNAGKSTLLRSLSNSKTRVGDWPFTTLQPNIGTVVLDNHKGHKIVRRMKNGELRTNFTIADIPGLIEDAHLDKGLGLEFLKHVERAAVLAFVVDLSGGDPVATLKALWKEVGEYDALKRKKRQGNALFKSSQVIEWSPGVYSVPGSDAFGDEGTRSDFSKMQSPELPDLTLPPVTSKPWLVVATKADLPGTQARFLELQAYLSRVQHGELAHPSGDVDAWDGEVHVVPISAIKAEGVQKIPDIVLGLLDEGSCKKSVTY